MTDEIIWNYDPISHQYQKITFYFKDGAKYSRYQIYEIVIGKTRIPEVKRDEISRRA